jgi:hypothetical protein
VDTNKTVRHYLQLFPVGARKALFGKYKNDPTFMDVVEELVARQGDGYDRSRFSFQRGVNGVYFFEAAHGDNGLGFLTQLRDADPETYMLKVASLALTEKTRDQGFCYLDAVQPYLRVAYGAIFGVAPCGTELCELLDPDILVSVQGQVAHFPPVECEQVVPLRHLPVGVRVGGEFVSPHVPVAPPCCVGAFTRYDYSKFREKTRLFFPLVYGVGEGCSFALGPDDLVPSVLLDTQTLRWDCGTDGAWRYPSIAGDTLPTVESEGWVVPNCAPCGTRFPCDVDSVNFSYVHTCGGASRIVMAPGWWAFELEPGESVLLGDIRLSAVDRPMVIAGQNTARFLYRGGRAAVVCRSFSEELWARFVRTRFQVSDVSMVSHVLSKTLAGCLFVPTIGRTCEGGLSPELAHGLRNYHYGTYGTGEYDVGPYGIVTRPEEGYLLSPRLGALFHARAGASVDICGGMCVAYPGARILAINGGHGSFAYRVRPLLFSRSVEVGLAEASDVSVDDGGWSEDGGTTEWHSDGDDSPLSDVGLPVNLHEHMVARGWLTARGQAGAGS